MVWEACAGPQLISVGFMHEDLWREPGLTNTACLASRGREHELTNIFIPDNYFKVVPPWLNTELSKTQCMICVLADILWSVFSPLPVLIDFAFLELHDEQTDSRRSLLPNGRNGELCRLKPGPPPSREAELISLPWGFNHVAVGSCWCLLLGQFYTFDLICELK